MRNTDPELDPVQNSALSRHANSLSYFDTRWLWGIALVTPLLLSAGVYWLHHMPSDPNARFGPTTVEVRLVQELSPAVAMQSSAAASEQQTEPLVETPNQTIPEKTTDLAYAPEVTNPGTKPELEKAAPVSRPRPMTSGIATTFQRTLIDHITRFHRGRAQHGVTLIVFQMRRDGTVSNIRVGASSGDKQLDEIAVNTVRRAQPLPRIPSDLPDQLTVDIALSFDPS